ncbi:hypothetical protein [Lacticaseibacillus hulanensis]|uniref:hypothetical protein n=1 Tax=Lacticaseibacillus hulanensis TaxID=2493111 RepID=UPI000FDC4F4C|nr:hypothetical protein [Lacticaseibacillus hulanensis]
MKQVNSKIFRNHIEKYMHELNNGTDAICIIPDKRNRRTKRLGLKPVVAISEKSAQKLEKS